MHGRRGTEVRAGSARLDVIRELLGLTRWGSSHPVRGADVGETGHGIFKHVHMCCRTAFQPCEGDWECATRPPLETPSINQAQTRDTSEVGDCRPVVLLALQRCKIVGRESAPPVSEQLVTGSCQAESFGGFSMVV